METSGPLIEQTGGIASGMSGSPVFVDGRLVGAIAYGFGYADHRIGLVTPIGDMLRVLERMGAEDAAAQAPSPVGPRQVAFAPDEATAAQLLAQLPPGTEVLVPLATPLMAAVRAPALHLVEGGRSSSLGSLPHRAHRDGPRLGPAGDGLFPAGERLWRPAPGR